MKPIYGDIYKLIRKKENTLLNVSFLPLCKIREDIEEKSKLLGKRDSAFDYSKAPRRGRLEGTRDFTHKKMYLKYYEDSNDPQPDTV